MESLRTPVTILRLFTGVISRVVAVVLFLIGVEVAFSGMFSDSEFVSSVAATMVCFLAGGAISFNISFWFSAKILVRSDMISFLNEDLISSRFSVSTLGDLLVPATGFKFWLVSSIGVSTSVETNSSTAFLFWLLVVILERERVFFGKLEFFKEIWFSETKYQRSKLKTDYLILQIPMYIYFHSIICSSPKNS